MVFGSGFATLGRGTTASSRGKAGMAGVVLRSELSLKEQPGLMSPWQFPLQAMLGALELQHPELLLNMAIVTDQHLRGKDKRQARVAMGT